MEKIFSEMLDKTIRNLDALQKRGYITYKVFTADDEWGDLEVVTEEKKKKKNPTKYPIGTLRNHFLPYVANLAPDELTTIPADKFDLEEVRGSACAWCSVAWGKGSYTSTVNRKTNCVEIYRHAK